MANTDNVHIGHLIKAELVRQRRSVAWLADQMCCHRNNVYHILQRSWIDTTTLMRISLILHHDFNADLSEWFRMMEKQDDIAQ